MKIRDRIKSEFDNSCMVRSFMSYKILVRKRLNYIIFCTNNHRGMIFGRESFDKAGLWVVKIFSTLDAILYAPMRLD